MNKYTMTYTVAHTSGPVDYVITMEAATTHQAIEYLLSWNVGPEVTPLTIAHAHTGANAGDGRTMWPITKDTPTYTAKGADHG